MIATAIENQDREAIQKVASVQFENGADFIDINAGIFVDKEADHLKWLVSSVQEVVDAPCCIDSPDPQARISTGGKQYKLAQGDVCRVEKLDAEEGASVEIDKVLMIADGDNINIGTPFVDGGKVTATVKAHGRAKKVEIMKFKRRKHHQKRTGHRQYYTEIEVTGISA